MLQPPTFLAVGHVTRDLSSDGSFVLGGTVTYAAMTAHRLGLVAGIVTCADSQFLAELPSYLPNITLHACLSAKTTTFANRYHDGFRTQYLHARAASLQMTDIPASWRDTSIVLLSPLVQELCPEFATVFVRRPENIIAATAQGWLRRWDEDGRVWPTPWHDAPQILPLLDALILSHDDLLPFADGSRSEADAILARWSMDVPLLVATDGPRGATLLRHGIAEHFPAYQAHEVDPTGAGDVFAAAFLVHLHRYHDPGLAVPFANCVAACSIEQEGIKGIPTLEMVAQRLNHL